MDMSPVLSLCQDPLRELFSLQIEADDPEQAILQVEGRFLDLILSDLVRISHHLQVFHRHFDAAREVGIFTFLPPYDLVKKDSEDLFAAL